MFILALYLWGSFPSLGWGLTAEQKNHAAESVQWLRFFQYQRTHSGYKSQIPTKEFFLSTQGMTDPAAELEQSLKVFASSNEKIGLLRQPPLCAFPARAQLLEKLLGVRWNWPSCPDLETWLTRLNADQLSVVFAGAYANNPASLFGHTFLRFSKKKEISLESSDLLTQSVGFLAAVENNATGVSYIINGITGRYMGYYNVQPYYMSTALYNHSESRDLWEYPLRLSVDQVRWLSLYLWELTFNSGIPYYFIDYNCSYRLLSFLEASDPELSLTSSLGFVVLPLDTIRALDDLHLIKRDEIRFRPSILRKLQLQLDQMSSLQLQQWRKSIHSFHQLQTNRDVRVLDALVDYWTYKNYRASAQLTAEQQKIFEGTFEQRALFSPILKDENNVLLNTITGAPDLGHHSSWWDFGAGSLGSQSRLFTSYRLGVHDFMMNPSGYDEFASIEYLGFDISYELEKQKWTENRFVLGKVLSLQPLTLELPTYSWLFEATIDEDCFSCTSKQWGLNLYGGVGVSYQPIVNQRLSIFAIPTLRSVIKDSSKSALLYGGRFGWRWFFKKMAVGFFVDQETSLLHDYFEDLSGTHLQISYFMERDWLLFLRFEHSSLFSENLYSVGLKRSY